MAKQRASNNHFIDINLLPSEFKQSRIDLSWLLDVRVMWSTFAIILVAVVLSLLYFRTLEKVGDLQNAVNQTNQAIEKERPLLNKINVLDEKLKGIEQKSNALRSIQVSRKRWVILFEDLSTALPPGTWITGMSQTANKMDLICSTWNFPEVALYMIRLEQKESITEVSLTNVSATKVNNEDAYNFSLNVGFNSNLGLETGVR
jgi:type IV pilus assembly protein PilN